MERKIYRGELYYADLSPVMGSEQGGTRPVLVIQNNRGNIHSPTIIVAALTKRTKPALPTHVLLQRVDGLKEDSVVLLEQIRTIDKRRLKEYIGKVKASQITVINHALALSVGLIRDITEPIELCLCSICAEQFFSSDVYQIRRVDKTQKIKSMCTYCNSRFGFDYQIIRK